MEIEHTSMTKVKEKGYDITIEYEHTIATAQYENYKPKLIATVPIEDLNGMMGIMRRVLSFEKIQIQNSKE